MDRAHHKAVLLRRSLAWALCYLLALYAFAAGFGTALVVAHQDKAAAGFIICHGSGGDTPVPGDAGTPPKAFCALCAVGASSALPPHDATAATVSPAACGRLDFITAAVSADLPFARAGLSRGPPNLA